jgi:leader peptidase (prepilin peptidase)/N-methyltransferase
VDLLLPFFLGILGAAFGSFVALVASRYDPDRFLLRPDMLSGRSRCDSCGATLGFFDLIPILSYLFLRGKCRHCGASFPSSLFFAEVIGAGIFLSAFFLFHRYVPIGTSVSGTLFFFIGWTVIFFALLLIALIDIRIQIIPDELVVLIGALGLFLPPPAFIGPFAFLLGGGDLSLWMVRLFGFLFGAGFFGGITLLTRGRGMGVGDVKLAGALGIAFGWPDVLLLTFLSFVIGSVWGLWGIVRHRMGRKTALPFGPFLTLATLMTFFAGTLLVRSYLGIIGFK